MTELMFEDFIAYFPSIGTHAIKYWESSTYELSVELDDGTIAIFDYTNKTIRWLSQDDYTTEQKCKYEFGRRLKRLMFIKGVTQMELADMTGISQTLLSGYITGRVSPTFPKVDKICRALDCSMDELRYITERNNR